MEPQQQNNQNNNIEPVKKDMPFSGGIVPPVEKPEEKITFHPSNDKVVIHSMRTYADDVKDAIQNDDVSVVKIALAEAKKQEEQKSVEEELSPTSDKNKKIILLSLIVLIVAVVGVVLAWNYMGTKNQVDVSNSAQHIASMVPYDEVSTINLDSKERNKLVDGILATRQQSYQSDTKIVYIPIYAKDTTNTSLLNTEGFLATLEARAPDALVRSFGQTFMFGLSKNNNQVSPFLLLSSDSFDQMYAGMLEWEPSMADDIGALFFSKEDLIDSPIQSTVVTTATSTAKVSTTTISATTTSASTSVSAVPEQKAFQSNYIIASSLRFKDELANNKNMRVLRTSSGKALMYYTYINDKLVLIGKDFGTLDEILKRLATSQFKQ